MTDKKPDKSCWTCEWGRLGGVVALPVCWWFVKSQGIVKEVPPHVVDRGCRFHTTEPIDFIEIQKFLKKPSKEAE